MTAALISVIKAFNPVMKWHGLYGVCAPLPTSASCSLRTAAFHLAVLLFLPNEYGDNETNETIFTAMRLRCADEDYQTKVGCFVSSLSNENNSCMKLSSSCCILVPSRTTATKSILLFEYNCRTGGHPGD